jgi:multiple sugar transport system substrate-binding protein
MPTRREFLAFSSLQQWAIAATACGTKTDNGSSDHERQEHHSHVLGFESGHQSRNDKEVLTPVLADFTKKTGIKVNLEVIGWNDLQTRIQTAITSGQGPDALNIGNTWGVSLQATGGLLPFGAAEMKAIGGADKFVKAALETGGAPRHHTNLGCPSTAWPMASTTTRQCSRPLGSIRRYMEEMVDAGKKLTDPSKASTG